MVLILNVMVLDFQRLMRSLPARVLTLRSRQRMQVQILQNVEDAMPGSLRMILANLLQKKMNWFCRCPTASSWSNYEDGVS